MWLAFDTVVNSLATLTVLFIYRSEVVYLEVNNEYVNKSITNVIGQIYGSIEPDKLVLLGNHRDAWVFGGVDPSSGTAILMEVWLLHGGLYVSPTSLLHKQIANVLGQLKKTGWHPGRTIVLCSWGAEEFGLLGSTEYAQVCVVLILTTLGYHQFHTGCVKDIV